MPNSIVQLVAESPNRPWVRQLVLFVFVAGFCSIAAAADTFPEAPSIGPVPVDFVLFGLTLLGVALLHRHTLKVALFGLAAITAYKIDITGFKEGAGIEGFFLHLQHEWV